jgi:F-type H+-transporting ATPase subunit delta
MEGTRVASRYAKSFIDLALEQGILEKAYADMKFIAEVSRTNHEFVTFLKSPIINADKKQAVLKAVFSDKVNKVTDSYIQLIAAKKREMFLDQIAEEFINQYNEKKKILKAVVTTASGIDDATRKQVMNLVKGASESEVVLEEKIDKNIIGGFIIRVGDKQIDASIARKLSNLKRGFKENPFVQES